MPATFLPSGLPTCCEGFALSNTGTHGQCLICGKEYPLEELKILHDEMFNFHRAKPSDKLATPQRS